MCKISRNQTHHVVRVTAMSKRFHAEAKEAGPFDPARVSGFLSGVCRSGRAAMFVAENEEYPASPKGFLVAQCGENYLTGEVIAEETAIFVMPDHRAEGVGQKLFDAFESWARDEMKANRIRVTAQSSLRPEAVAKWFARRGFKEAERSFTKEVII